MAIAKGKIDTNSSVVTFGDPKYNSNHQSSREVNTQGKPERAGKSEPDR